MKELKTRKITKEIKTFELHPSLKGVTLKATYENGKLKEAVFQGKGPHESYPTFVKPGFWDLLKKFSPWWQVKGVYPFEKLYIEAKDILADPSLAVPENFVWHYGSGHMLFDLKGDPIPVPYWFDYIGTPFSNEYCDLDKLLPHLKKHAWVLNGADLTIDKVPYYNNESGRKKFIRGEELPCIAIMPDKKSYKEMYLRAVEKDKQFFSIRVKEYMFSDAPYNWKTTKEKDYLKIRQFYKPHEQES